MPIEREASEFQRARLAARLVEELLVRSHGGRAAGWPSKIVADPACPARGLDARKRRSILFAEALVPAILEGRKTLTRRLVKPPALGECPYGVPGDRLWVREKWGHLHEFFPGERRRGSGFVYAADGLPAGATRAAWRPSLHMPRAACRIELAVTAVRVERLREITDEEALAEGCPAERRDDPVGWFRETWDALSAGGRGAAWEQDPWVWVSAFRVLRGGGERA